jgi:hypothetical protein
MKSQKPIWRKIKGKWVNLIELSKEKKFNSIMPCDEFSQTYRWQKTNKNINLN